MKDPRPKKTPLSENVSLTLAERQAFLAILEKIGALEGMAGQLLVEVRSRLGLPPSTQLELNRRSGEVRIKT